jgi:16S rRNA (guanine527-N7)-methyltransferase
LDGVRSMIREDSAEVGVSLSADQVAALSAHLEMVLAENRQLNLTAVTEPEQAVWLHVVDSLLGLPMVQGAPAGPLCDLGSGAGYPGLALCIASGRHTTLVESVGKKARFLSAAIAATGADAEVLAERAEQIGRTRGGTYAVVTVRAVSALPSILELAAPLLIPRGTAICYKGSPESDEVARGDKAAAMVGLERVQVEHTTLGEAVGSPSRTLFVYERTGDPHVALPRREGVAQHSPLA